MLFVGTPNGLESRLVPDQGIAFVPLAARGFDRSRPLSLVSAGAVMAVSTARAIGVLRRWRPDVVIGFGGYVSIPVGLAAAALRIPLVLHEQNSTPGLANRLLSRFAVTVGVTYEDSIRRLVHPDRACITGNPVRADVLVANRETARANLGYTGEDVVLLVFGGSRGARHINDTMLTLYSRLREMPKLRVLHVAGRIEAASVRERLAARDGETASYRVVDYMEDMGSALAAADLVISRAGATSIAEITALGRPSILVPYPFATDDHQTGNARSCVAAGAAVLVQDRDLDAPGFGDTVLGLIGDPARRERMGRAAARLGRPQAAEAVAEMARAAGATRRRVEVG